MKLTKWLQNRTFLKNTVWPIKCQCCPHIENSQEICTANELTGFYMRVALAFNGLTPRTLRPWLSAIVTEHWTDQKLWGLKQEGISIRKPGKNFFDFLCFTFWLLFHWKQMLPESMIDLDIYSIPDDIFYPNIHFTRTHVLPEHIFY